MIAPWDEEYEPVEAVQPPGRGPWFGLSQSAAFRSAQTDAIGSELRLFLYAVARADKFGHAEFGPGELEQRLGIQASGVRKQIAKLKAAGLAAPEASARCVLLAYEIRGGGHRPDDPLQCGEHGPMGAATARREPVRVPESSGAAFWLDLYRSEAEAVLTGSAPTL
ncbi:hypothetical protein SAZ_18575 [Streptomyces noursei ZPM]|uniref:Uncharacterized protein n=1 Tax=Streptomyces noursei TaxID=1971 RepID=A0A401R1Z0_STRNR|nr:hypothetical protein [Streptomyces noursei]AKA08729.1 hypothetical protein SAZ_18575 [Streptomyces noursei ZPM]EOT03683.1 hypothetical protein K530_12367 [Streptomyces noursei CCRC 11814]EXU85856.1 hypothetical protein P354_06270 [Streptomyces noursei PD-1]MCZ0974013.1 hypothetical protein [Streptomyces noursei]UWS72620.1 hypothetical protein N1H47_15990 [Streptomyces noursei]